MLKKGIKGIVILAVIVVLGVAGMNKYMDTVTNVQYGQIPDEVIPAQFDKVTYTIPTIDEEGNRSTQTFTVDNEKDLGRIVRLAVRNDKVKKHEFISKEEVPEKVRRNLPAESF